MKPLIHITICLLMITQLQSLQASTQIDSASTPSYFTLGMSNDLLQNRSKSDKYFSAAFIASYYSETFDNDIARKILLGNDNGYNIFGLVARQNGFTPDNLSLVEVDSSDRPYCGTLLLQYQRYSTNNNDWVFTSALKIGVSGPASYTENVQKWIHERTNSETPMGWDNQIANSLIIDYFASAKKELLQVKDILSISATGYGEVGTFSTSLGAFSEIKIGWFNDEYKHYKGFYNKDQGQRKWQLYMDFAIGANMVLYDGTLQGGLIPFSESPYTYTWSDYEHFTGQFRYQLTISYKGFSARYRNVVETNRYFLEDAFSFGQITLTAPIGN